MKENERLLILGVLKKILETHYSGSVFVFGSRARGDFRPHSDLDLLFELTPVLSLKTQLQLQDAFQESDLPYKVDVVSIQNLLPEYRDGVLKDQKLLLQL